MNTSLNTFLNKKYDQLTDDLNTKIEEVKKSNELKILQLDKDIKDTFLLNQNKIVGNENPKNTYKIDCLENKIKSLEDSIQSLKNLSANIKLQIKSFAEIREHFESETTKKCEVISAEIEKLRTEFKNYHNSPDFSKFIESIVKKILDTQK